MAMTTCPHCEGAKKNYIIEPESDPPKLKEKNCVLCGGSGEVPVNEPVVPDPPKPPEPPELWPLLIPLGIFVLFFFFLWL